MFRRKGNDIICDEEKPQQCDMCSEIRELRPYGPKGECVCVDCGMKDPEAATRKAMSQLTALFPEYEVTPESEAAMARMAGAMTKLFLAMTAGGKKQW